MSLIKLSLISELLYARLVIQRVLRVLLMRCARGDTEEGSRCNLRQNPRLARADELNSKRRMILTCRTGHRSSLGCSILEKKRKGSRKFSTHQEELLATRLQDSVPDERGRSCLLRIKCIYVPEASQCLIHGLCWNALCLC